MGHGEKYILNLICGSVWFFNSRAPANGRNNSQKMLGCSFRPCVVVASPFCIVIIQNDSISTFETAPRARDSGRGPLFFFSTSHTHTSYAAPKKIFRLHLKCQLTGHISKWIRAITQITPFYLALIVIQMLVGGGARNDVMLFWALLFGLPQEEEFSKTLGCAPFVHCVEKHATNYN